ncbi:polysaccharide biosynthesis protein [Haloterrigena turkmenica DSM 5511]|uniref:Polysaccharide biosynthesis protein n=1 Tax=Haloterrigena turkmenica (strain ATCC 51198 / DSM 5511 / JCM 9101 / NCIMB 13204 / VKM B-1734 / 4k) TaxID=543526 RepID=D2RY69_HALTV|nr:polysaccharide biosynthesis C-terminal domain-containing protein [Haloterrigena turkmenica]ADB61815.1 polysaccharide biosynthesis protein [Haloterrigena turkmenica DSM 5511]
MRLGQTSIIYFLSKLFASGLGFLATIYIARMLGPGPLGVYSVAIGLVSWLAIAGKVGLSGAISKRVSEGEDRGEYALAGTTIIFSLFVLVACGLVLFRTQVADYIGYPATGYIVLILLVVLLNSLINSLLVGLHLVHVSGVLSPVRTGGRALLQIALIATGAGTAGLFTGHIVGYCLVIGIGGFFIARNLPDLSRPKRRHFERLVDFAKFSWLGSLQSKMFSYTDIIVLGVFVSSGLIGVYAAAWNIAEFLILFSGALSSTLFPEISSLSAEEDSQVVARIVEQSLSFGGLFLVPGLFGGALLGERILRIYGPEFPKGSTILTVLIVANLLMGYQNQLLNTLNAIDRPDLAFRVNVVFVAINVTLNVGLISLYGWLGAAVATTVSVAASLVLAYYHVDTIIDFAVPTGEIAKQWFAAVLMAGVVYAGLWTESTYRLLNHNVATVVLLVSLGAGVYFTVLLAISTEFRTVVDQNVPFGLPILSSG